MADTCPHCGAALPMCRDAFCPDCRMDLAEPARSPLQRKVEEALRPRFQWVPEFIAALLLLGAIYRLAARQLLEGGAALLLAVAVLGATSWWRQRSQP